MAIRPLGLPAGSVRALLLLCLAARAILSLRADGTIPPWLVTALILSAASYFAARAAANARRRTQGGETLRETHPLGLPAGFVRTLFLAAVAYGTWLWFDRHGSGAVNAPVAWILLAYVVGLVARLVLSKLRLPEDPGAGKADHLLALVSLIAGLALPVGKSSDMPGFAEPLLAAVVVHYFATRS
jgi:hypothetical protein